MLRLSSSLNTCAICLCHLQLHIEDAKVVIQYPKRGEKEESDLTQLIQEEFALSKVADHVYVSAQIDCMTACSPFRLPVLTCRAEPASCICMTSPQH